MKSVNKFLAFAVLCVAGQAVHTQAPPTLPSTFGADVPELMRLLKQKENDRYLHIDMRNKQLQGAQLVGRDLSNIKLNGANLSNANLQNCIFIDAVLKQTIMAGADLTGANFSGALCENVNFQKAILNGANFTGATLERCDLRWAILANATLINATFNHVVDVRATNFTNSKGFTSIKFSNETYLNDARGLTLAEQEYARAQDVIGVPGKDIPALLALFKQKQANPTTSIYMENADLAGFQLDVYGANLRGARLPGANLRGARLFGNLENAQLPGADLDGASIGGNFVNVNLQGAKLTNITQTTHSQFISAELSGADFTGSRMPFANFHAANFDGAKGLSPELKTQARSNGALNIPK